MVPSREVRWRADGNADGFADRDRDDGDDVNREAIAMVALYVTEPGSYLATKGGQLQVVRGRDRVAAVPVVRLSHVVAFGRCTVSHGAVNLLLREHVPVLFLTSSGRYCGRLASERVAQIDRLTVQVDRAREPGFGLTIARAMVAAKLLNGRVLLQRLNRSRRSETVTDAIARVGDWAQRAQAAERLEELLGCEGQGTKVYFGGLGDCVRPPFSLTKRTKRPPTDPVNALLSLGYTLLFQHLFALVQAAGLHPHFGHLHVPSPRYAALVADLVEEFRAPVVDSLVLKVANQGILSLGDFLPPGDRGQVWLRPAGLKVFLTHWQGRLHTTVLHPNQQQPVTYLRFMELQVWEYLAVLMGDRAMYRPLRSRF